MFKANYWKRVLLIVAVVGISLAGAVDAQEITTLVAAGSTWKYYDIDTDLYSAGWPSVDDSGWLSGPAPLGFGDPHILTGIAANSPRHTCYFRHTFNVANPSIYESLTLRILRDDGCVVYLNDTEVLRSNMPGGDISHSTWSSAVVGGADETTYFEFSLDPAVLVAGDNVFAVDVHQCNSTSSDLGLDLELEAVGVDPYSPYPPALVAPTDGATSVSTSPTLEVTVSDPQGDVLDVEFYGRSMTSGAEEFVIVALPDTQKYVNSTGDPDIFTSQTQWIVNNKGSQNIVFVTHEGDITDSTDRVDDVAVVEAEWIKASYSMSLLDDGFVSYGVCPGNHDKPGTVDDFYNIYFPYTRFGYGHYPENGNDNNYNFFSAGGMDFIIVHLQVYPDQGVFDWANEILGDYPNRIAILTMHQYLNTDGSRMSVGDTVWNQVIVPNNNVQFVFCGHNHGEAYRMDVEDGREVHQLLADYQDYPNGGNGYLRIMRFVPYEDTVYVKTYSPWLGQYATDGDSQFTIDFPMGEPFSLISSNTGVTSGINASVEWSGLSIGTDYEWFVEVTDPTYRKTVGPVWSFTTGLAPEASNPNPPNGVTGVNIDTDLSWSPGIGAVSHDVFFGTNPTPGPSEFQGNQEGTTFDPGTMANDTTFYWRIDEFDGDTTHQGYVWSFTTAPVPGPASNPDPADGATEVSIAAQLSWTAGSDTTSHSVYFGDTYPPAFIRNQSGTTFDPGTLDNDVTYYWQIDEIGPGGITLGIIWSFTVEPVLPELPWSDGFESGSFAVGGWTTSGNAVASSKAAYTGIYGAEIKGTAWIEKAVSTVGFANIHVIYACNTKGLDSGEYLNIEWYDGSNWNTLQTTQNSSWSVEDNLCGAGANNNIAFKIRFSTNASNSSECGYVDDVLVTGTPSGPVNDPPVVSISTPLDNATFDSGALINFAGTAMDTEDGDLTDNLAWQSDIDGSIGIGGSVSATLSDGEHLITVSVTDSGSKTGSDSINIMVGDPPPVPPTGLVATAGNGQVSLDWENNTELDIAGYNVYRSEASGGPYTQLNGALVTTSDYLDSAVTNGTTYYYVVTAVDMGENISGNSNEISATPSSQQTVYVESIEMSLLQAGKNWKAVAGVTINPSMSGATIVGNWYLDGTVLQTDATGVTDGSGYAELTSPPKKANSGDIFMFFITNVVLSGYVYNLPDPPDSAEIAVQ